MSVAFDTLDYANTLKEAGVDPKIAEVQAELQAKVLRGFAQNQLATKADIIGLEVRLEEKIANLRYELLVKLGSTIVGCSAILGVLITIFLHR